MKTHRTKTHRAGLAAMLFALLAILAPGSALAAGEGFAIDSFGASFTGPGGDFSRQAGAHPDLRVKLHFAQGELPPGSSVNPLGNPRDTVVDLPPGLVGDPTVVEACPQRLLVRPGGGSDCPIGSQVGFVRIEEGNGFEPTEPLFNLEHGPGTPALLGFEHITAAVLIEAQVRPGDHGITTLAPRISQAVAIEGAEVTIWGVPADPVHDPERGYGGASIAVPRRPFLRTPTSCPPAAVPFTVSADSWQDPGIFDTHTFTDDLEGIPFVLDGCERLPFAPAITAQPDTRRAESPAGLSVDLTVPQSEAPDGLATADVRKTVVTFPKGVAISSSAASGQGSCAPDQIKLGTNAPPTCPDSSKVGTVEIETPLLEEPVKGNVILAKQNDNPFNSLLALYIAVKGPGFYLKLPGKVDLDPVTGQVTSTFDNTPQLPFEHLRLRLDGGSRAPLVTPSACGIYSTHVEMTSWASSIPVQLNAPMTIDEGCGTGGFSPGLEAGSQSALGGAFSPFLLRITRNDGEQNLAQINATLPPGVLAKLAGVGVCPEALTASGACPAASQVGTTTVGAGPGSTPVFVPEPGRAPTAVYLAGPYKGAPYSLVVKVPAQAGPFDLGTVTVRNALYIDPVTTQVTAKSDPLPQILQGIPITYRDVRVEVNRPQFTLNPTSCEPMKVTSTLVGANGASASPTANFQAANCERLGFGPSLALKLSGATKRSGNPALTAVLKAPPGQANIAKTTVILPKTLFIDNAHINNPCTRVQFNAGACPKGSVLGTARAFTPLLDEPLEGPVYFRSNGGERNLPDLFVDLNGQIHATLVGFIDSVKVGKEGARVRTRFLGVPDAPVSKFVLRLKGGKAGLIDNSTNLCRNEPKADVKMTGQNGKPHDFVAKIATSCGKAKKQKRRG